MNLFILGDAITPPYNYQGVDRANPSYIWGLEDEHPANQAFFWSTSVWDDGYLHDLDKAKELVDIYARLEPPQFFEVVQITQDDESIDIPGDFLGYDIASFNYSVVSTGMGYCSAPDTLKRPDILAKPLICLIQKHFQPQLNENGLFAHYSVAKECLDCMTALHNLTPESELWEMHHPTTQFKVAGLYRIYRPNK
jgi:hypothetical protein